MIANNTKVELVNLDGELSGLHGIVTGISNKLPPTRGEDSNCYIVTFDKLLSNGYNSIAITAHCLKII